MKYEIFNEEDIAKYFAGELDEKKIEMMEKFLMSDSDKEQEMNEFARLWEKATEVGKYDQIDINSDWQNVRSRMGFQSKPRSFSIKRIVYAAAAVIVLVLGTAVVMNMINKRTNTPSSNEYLQIASNDTQREVVLPDSTIIFLNRQANIVYNNNYGITNRDVVLTGEAFFNVHKNKKLPFKVFSESSTIEVLGTSFNIKPSKNEVTVSVITGHVAFYESTKKENRVELIHDQQTRYNSSERIFEPVKVMDPNLLAWRTHKLSLNNYTAVQAFEEVSDYFEVELSIDKQLNFTEKGLKGPINVSTPELAFKDLHDLVNSEEYETIIRGNKLIVRKR